MVLPVANWPFGVSVYVRYVYLSFCSNVGLVAPFSTTKPVGQHQGFTFLLYIWHDGQPVSLFETEVFYRKPRQGQTIQVARIHNANGPSEFEQLFKPHQPTVGVNKTWRGAYRQLQGNWRQYARAYDSNHGL